jgi:hypothetical protein
MSQKKLLIFSLILAFSGSLLGCNLQQKEITEQPQITGQNPEQATNKLKQSQLDIAQKIQSKITHTTLKQNSNNLDILYQQAAIADQELQKMATEIAGSTGGIVKKPPGLKGKERTLEKINTEYGGDASRITDLTRISIFYEDLDHLYQGLSLIAERSTIVRIKDRFQEPLPDGYRDILLNLKMSNEHIAEMQLHLNSIIAVKEGKGHDLYEQVRKIQAQAVAENRPLTAAELNQIERLTEESALLYNEAFKQANQ